MLRGADAACVVVEDGNLGVVAAARAGLPVLGLASDDNHMGELGALGGEVIRSMRDVPEHVRRVGSRAFPARLISAPSSTPSTGAKAATTSRTTEVRSMINPVHLRTLQAVLSTGSFATAARELGYTSSAVSQQMHARDRATDVLLFERGAQGIRPTSAAHLLAERMRSTLVAFDELERDVQKLATGEEGPLYLGAFTTASTGIVPPALANLMTHCPNAQVRLTEGEPPCSARSSPATSTLCWCSSTSSCRAAGRTNS